MIEIRKNRLTYCLSFDHPPNRLATFCIGQLNIQRDGLDFTIYMFLSSVDCITSIRIQYGPIWNRYVKGNAITMIKVSTHFMYGKSNKKAYQQQQQKKERMKR